MRLSYGPIQGGPGGVLGSPGEFWDIARSLDNAHDLFRRGLRRAALCCVWLKTNANVRRDDLSIRVFDDLRIISFVAGSAALLCVARG